MTDTQTYTVAGSQVVITATTTPTMINLTITVDLTALDNHLPDHSPHNLIGYINLQGYAPGSTYWWCKTKRNIKIKTASQARRIIKSALTKIDDAVSRAILARDCRLAEATNIFS